MRIVLSGFRGTGKTECGRLLSKLIGLPFLDTDAMIEERTGMTIHEIFSRDGEKAFREHEQQVIASLPASGCIVSTGGGAVMNPENVARLRKGSTMILLEACRQPAWLPADSCPVTCFRQAGPARRACGVGSAGRFHRHRGVRGQSASGMERIANRREDAYLGLLPLLVCDHHPVCHDPVFRIFSTPVDGIGSGQAVAMVTTTTYLLHRASPEMRGRIMGIRGLAIISLFGGNLVGGAFTGWLGAPTALVIFGTAGILSTIALFLRLPSLRRHP